MTVLDPAGRQHPAVAGRVGGEGPDRRDRRHGDIVSETVTLPAGEALRLTYTLTVPNAAGDDVKTSQALYWIQTDKRTIVVTGTGPDAAKDAELQAIVESIEAV